MEQCTQKKLEERNEHAISRLNRLHSVGLCLHNQQQNMVTKYKDIYLSQGKEGRGLLIENLSSLTIKFPSSLYYLRDRNQMNVRAHWLDWTAHRGYDTPWVVSRRLGKHCRTRLPASKDVKGEKNEKTWKKWHILEVWLYEIGLSNLVTRLSRLFTNFT